MIDTFVSPAGIVLQRTTTELDYATDLYELATLLDRERGMFLSSGVEYPGRYSRWDICFYRPSLEFVAKGRELTVNALSPRGETLLNVLANTLTVDVSVHVRHRQDRQLSLHVTQLDEIFAEEERSLQATVFTPLRALLAEFKASNEAFLGLYGAFGYDLIFQFEMIDTILPRPADGTDLHLFLPDSIYVRDRRMESLFRYDYTFSFGAHSTAGLDNTPYAPLSIATQQGIAANAAVMSTPSSEKFMANVDAARRLMSSGDIYEIVLHRRFSIEGAFVPSQVWKTMKTLNPSPYEFLCQLGREQLIGTSPEMFIRVVGSRIESCPISGTVRRGTNAIEDADAIKQLLNSHKDEVELTMCTDVDRNDKARICQPGSVKLLDRRLIERYAGLFHTVDHVEGQLRPEMGGIDAFLSHMWAVTLTGSPKPMAVRLIEQMESEARGWYGGAVGALLFNGDVSTGITIRTLHLQGGTASYRAGATLVYDSIAAEEELETRTKATVFLNLVRELKAGATQPVASIVQEPPCGADLTVVLIDNEDSFVQILADYFRQTGAAVTTYRHGLGLARIQALSPDLVVHSPGPGRPVDFGMPELVRALAATGIAQFGVCLGLQGIVEAFGGELDLLPEPRQGKYWTLSHAGTGLFEGVARPCKVGAYHALYAREATLPDSLEITARNETGIIMAVRHRDLPISAVQFHPESILSMHQTTGYRIIENLIKQVQQRRLNRGDV